MKPDKGTDGVLEKLRTLAGVQHREHRRFGRCAREQEGLTHVTSQSQKRRRKKKGNQHLHK